MAFIRVYVQLSRASWRNSLETFPTGCGDWALEGCTRLVLTEAECVRPGGLENTNTIVFDVGGQDELLYTKIDNCVNILEGAKLQDPKNLRQLTSTGELIHVTFQSKFFGFLDDMYLFTYIDPSFTQRRVVNMQS